MDSSLAFASYFTEATSKQRQQQQQQQAAGGSPLASPNRSILRLDTSSTATLSSGYSSGSTPPISVDEAARHLAVTPTRSPVRRLSFRSSTASDSNSSSNTSVSANGPIGVLGSTKASEGVKRTESASPTKSLTSVGASARPDTSPSSPKTPTRPRTALPTSGTNSSNARQPNLPPSPSPAAKRPVTANPPGRQTPTSYNLGSRSVMSAFGAGSSSAGASTSYRSKEMSPSYSAPSNRSASGGYYNSETQFGRAAHGSSKASQMLGIDPYSSVPISATSSFNSDASPPSTSSGGTFKSSTLKKARSLFSSGNSKNAGNKSPNLPSPPLPQAYSQQLAHSRSHGSLQDARGSPMTGYATQGSPTASHRFPGDPYASTSPSNRMNYIQPSPGSSASHEHPFSASGTSRRKQSMPGSERRRPRIAEEEDDVACPVCLESLSIRLQGEKAHVVPVCGHKLHAECFETAYGSVSQSKSRKKGPLGICGICRSEMKIDEDGSAGGKGKNKFAAISGEAGHSPSSPTFPSESRRPGQKENGNASLHDPSEDQDVVNPHQYLPAYMQHIALGASRNGHGMHPVAEKPVQPKITVRAEHPTLVRSADPDQKVHLTCMVTVEIPSRVPDTPSQVSNSKSHVPSNSQSTILGSNGKLPSELNRAGERRESNATGNTEDFPTSPSVSAFSAAASRLDTGEVRVHLAMANAPLSAAMEKGPSTVSNTTSNLTPASADSSTFTTPGSVASSSFSSSQGHGKIETRDYAITNASSTTLTAAAQEEKDREAHGPFASVYEDLQTRMADWKGHEPANFGSLRMYDGLQVKKEKNVREFTVYLFEEALLCVVDDKKKHDSGSDKLRLKGRVFVRHMHRVEETTSVENGLSLTIHMEDDNLDSFVVLYRNRESLEVWRSQIQALIDHHRPPIPTQAAASSHSRDSASEDRRDSLFSDRSAGSRNTKATTAPSLSGSGKEWNSPRKAAPDQSIPPVPAMPTKSSAQPLEALAEWQPPPPETFVPVDLMLVVSVPAQSAGGPSSSALRLRLIKSTLRFVIRAVGPRARISIVAYTVGDPAAGATLRKTPWLATGRADGMLRLEQAVNEIAGESISQECEGLIVVDQHKEDKVTVASAVNLALDIVLQRQTKSATSAMLLLNDGKDGAQKQQIDLVMTRADAAKIPIYAFGWGKAHDPSSLWLLSNHTRGTYTFVRDYYHLKDAVAGCVGGLLSVAIATLKLHLNVQEKRWFKIRKVAGVGTGIVSADGKDVDITLGELRYGEKKEMLVEIEMASPRAVANSPKSGAGAMKRKSFMTATDDFFVNRAGMNPGSLTDLQQDFFEWIEEGMAEDVPIFEVNATFRNPVDLDTKQHKLPYPALLTTTVMPPPKGGPASPGGSSAVSDPTIVRRRMELLTSDMITRTLLLMSRRQDVQAQRLLTETTRIFGAIIANLVPPSTDENTLSPNTRYAHKVLLACLQDVEQLSVGCSDRIEFEQVTRNYGAQQAVSLRDQRAWTSRTATEGLFFAKEWVGIFGKAFNLEDD